jgi:nicotinamidase-related amidase
MAMIMNGSGRRRQMNQKRAPKEAWVIRPDKTVFVVIDMQRAFVDDGAPLKCGGAGALVPKINELASICRKLRIPVIFVKSNRRADGLDSGLMLDVAPGNNNELDPVQGKRGCEFCDGLDIQKEDHIVPKIRYSAMIQGASRLEGMMREMGRDSIIICGVATDVCVGTTAIDSMMLGFKVFFVGDLTATLTENRKKAALELYNTHFVKVMTLEAVKKELAQSFLPNRPGL